MNAGTFTQALTASRFKENPSVGSGAREKQEDAASFMDVFAQNLKDARRDGTKAAGRKWNEAADSKARDTADKGKNPMSADRAKQSGTSEESTCRGGSKTADSETEHTDNAEQDSQPGKSQNNSAMTEAAITEAAMSLQAMMPLLQEVPVLTGDGKAPDIQDAVMQTEFSPETGKTGQSLLINTNPEGYGQQAANPFREVVQPETAEAARGQTAQEAVSRPEVRQETADRTSDFVRLSRTDAMEAEMEAPVRNHKETQPSGEDMFSGMGGRQNKAFNLLREQAGTVDEEPGDVNQALEELKRNADARGLDLTGKTVQNRVNDSLRPVPDAREQQMETPVLEQLKTGFERAVKTDGGELTIHLKPEGLGDIVVRLTSAGEKMTVRIGVTNPETEKLVTSQMESLKEMLRPLNTEVQEVYHSSQNAMDFSGFSQHMPQRQGRQAHFGYSYHGTEDSGLEDELLTEAERMMAESRMSRLYAYV